MCCISRLAFLRFKFSWYLYCSNQKYQKDSTRLKICCILTIMILKFLRQVKTKNGSLRHKSNRWAPNCVNNKSIGIIYACWGMYPENFDTFYFSDCPARVDSQQLTNKDWFYIFTSLFLAALLKKVSLQGVHTMLKQVISFLLVTRNPQGMFALFAVEAYLLNFTPFTWRYSL